jgi:hypothetical protein
MGSRVLPGPFACVLLACLAVGPAAPAPAARPVDVDQLAGIHFQAPLAYPEEQAVQQVKLGMKQLYGIELRDLPNLKDVGRDQAVIVLGRKAAVSAGGTSDEELAQVTPGGYAEPGGGGAAQPKPAGLEQAAQPLAPAQGFGCKARWLWSDDRSQSWKSSTARCRELLDRLSRQDLLTVKYLPKIQEMCRLLLRTEDIKPLAAFEKRRLPYESVFYGPLLFALAIPDKDPNTPVSDARWQLEIQPCRASAAGLQV